MRSGSLQDPARTNTPGRRPKLLFLAWTFPPVNAIATVRTWNIAKYLNRLGWDVTVVTPRPNLSRHVENTAKADAAIAAEGIRQIFTNHQWRSLAPTFFKCRNERLGWLISGVCRRAAERLGIDWGVGWIKPAERACSKLTPNDVDLILVTGPPFATFVLAERISKKLGRPYVVDYRDPWSEPGSSEVGLEASLLAGAAAVTTVSKSWARDLEARYQLGTKLHVVTNGFDPEDLTGVPAHDFGHFAIVYAGIFYPPTRVITPVLEALQRLKGKHGSENCHFHYFGNYGDHVQEEAVRIGVADRVKLHGKVSRSEALSAIRGASIAVVINSVLEKASGRITGWVPAKVFEMIGLKTPILLIAPSGTDIESIAETEGVVRRFSGEDIDGIASFLEQLLAGRTSMEVQSSSNKYSWESIARALDSILRTKLMKTQTDKVPN